MSANRIASLLAAGTEILYALGLGDRVVAVSHECDYPQEVLSKPRISRTRIDSAAPSVNIDEHVRHLTSTGQSLYEIDVSLLASLIPDLIVTQSQCDVCAVSEASVRATVRSDARLSGASVLALNPSSLEGIFADIHRLGEAVGCEEVANNLVATLQRRVDAVRQAAARLPMVDRPRVVCIEWIEPLMVAANWMPDLVDLAGGLNGLTRSGDRSACTPWEDVRVYDPHVIVVMPCGFDLPRTLREMTALHSLPGWSELRAVRSGRVHAVDGNAYFNRSGPRMVDSLEQLAGLLNATTESIQ